MQEVVAASPGVPARRVLTATFAAFALLAIVLGGVGLFGVVAHDVASRRVELGLRVALGAHPARILNQTLAQGVLMATSGLVLGGVLSFWTIRAVAAVLGGVTNLDPLSIAAPVVVLVVMALAAVLPVALRAARTDPLLALRSE
jgi:putative ABC transport system permease protein